MARTAPRRFAPAAAIGAALVLALGSGAHAAATPAGEEPMVDVIVELNVSTVPETQLDGAATADQRATISETAEGLGRYGEVDPMVTTPVAVMQVPASRLDDLANDPRVARVTPDFPIRPLLAESTSRIGAPTSWARGGTGAGYNVAVLDTGVDTFHPMLAGKVVAEACFTAGSGGGCPNGSGTQIGAGAAAPCSPMSSCNHGTHVASIAAGDRPGSEADGVARGAGIIAVQVFANNGSGPASTAGDIIAALDWVYSARTSHPIAAVNLSLGGDNVLDGQPCPTGADRVISALRDAGIATVVAAGNDGANDRIAWPACSPYAEAVSATDDADNIAPFSNLSGRVGIAAPGSDIVAAITGGGYGTKSGTSMAAPHVAGAYAVLKASKPSASVSAMHDALVSTGTLAGRSGLWVRRINVAAAADALSNTPNLPSTPTGTIDAWIVNGTYVRAYGWAIDGDTRDPIPITVTANGRVIATWSANNVRPDLNYGAFGNNHGFDGAVIVDKGNVDVCLFAENVGPGSAVKLGCRTVSNPVK